MRQVTLQGVVGHTLWAEEVGRKLFTFISSASKYKDIVEDIVSYQRL